MLRLLSIALIPALAASSACPNNCNNKGSCGTANTCECHRGFFGPDCSQRICTFGYAFIDTPKGDLDGDLKLSPSRSFDPRENSQVVGIQNVIGGTSELYSSNYGYARANQTIPWNEAHFYRECSNKGICNRATGLCQCFPGYEGEGCVRLSCPNKCSGHGKCRTIEDANTKSYSAWDLKKTQMCVCDSGYEGPDCSQRSCPRGADPVKYAHYVTNSVQGVVFKANTAANMVYDSVYFTLTSTDEFGDKWTTQLMEIPYHNTGSSAGQPKLADAAALKSLVETFNASLSYNDGIDMPYVWGVHGSNVYPSSTLSTTSAGNAVFVDSQTFRLDAGIQTAVANICANGKKGLCFFIQNQNQGIQSPYRIDYWYHARIGTSKLRQIDGQTSGFSTGTFFNGDVTATGGVDLVSVINVQPNRQWLLKDGDVTKTFMSDTSSSLDVCSNRGLCDYATGLCNCFAGYTGNSCCEQNSIAYTY